ncbi:MAG: hypothetical protein ACJAYG_000166 [Oceanicoccus sp.]|jgi:hypothetical protein
MKRHFYISDSLEDLAKVETELKDGGIAIPQIHVLSQNEADLEHHNLHQVEAVLKRDVVHSMEIGAIVGVIASILVLVVAYVAGWTNSAAGWIPFIFLAVVVLGFCTWQGGLFGIQEPHYQFKRFQSALNEGKHVFFVDVTEQQKAILSKIVDNHPQLQDAGEGESTPEWVVEWQKNWNGFVKTMP